MKRILAGMIAVCMAVLCLPAAVFAAAETNGQFSDDFDAYADYAAAQAGGWYRGAEQTDEQADIIQNPTAGGGNRCVLLTTAGAGVSQIAHSGIGVDLIGQDYAVVALNLCAVNSAADRQVAVTDDSGGSYTLLTLTGDAVIGPDGKTQVGTIKGETWYQLAVAVDSAKGTGTVYLDGKKLGDALHLGGTPTSVDSVIISQTGSAGHSAAALVDDVRVCPGEAPDGRDQQYPKRAVDSIVLPAPQGSVDLPLYPAAGAEGIETYVKDDFTGYQTHPDWHGRDIPPNWYTGWNNNGRFQSYSFKDAHGDVVHFSASGSGQTPYIQREYLHKVVGRGDYVAQFDILMPDDNSAKAFSIADGNGNLRSVVRFKTDGSILFDTAGQATKIGMNTHKWMRFACVYHADTGLYDAYLDGQMVLEQKAMSGTVAPGMSRFKLDLTGDSKGASDAYVDNVAIYSGTKPVSFEQVPAPAADKFPNTVFDWDPDFSGNLQNAVALKIGSANAYVGAQRTTADPGNVNVKPFEENGVTMVPVRFIAEAFGAEVSFEEAAETVRIQFGGGQSEIRFQNGGDIAYVNGEEIQVTRPVSREDRIFVPIRFIAEKIGKKVYYNENGVIVIGDTETPFQLPEEEKAFTALTRKLTYTYPTKEQIKKDYYAHNGLEQGEKIQHPRMFADADKLADIRSRIRTDENMKAWYEGVKKGAESAYETQTPGWYFEADGSMLSRVREVMDKIEKWVMVYQMETDPAVKQKYLDRTWKEISGVVFDWPDWDHMHFLDPSEMMRCIALAYDWMYDGWTEEQRGVIRNAIIERGLQPAYDSYKGYGNVTWVKLENNWSLVCHGSVIIAALALFDYQPDYCAQLMEWAMHAWENVMYQFAPEGAWEEGVTYWNFAIRYYVPCIDVMNWFLGTDYGYFDDIEGVSRTGYYPPYMTGPMGQFNYHDAGEGFERTEAHFWMAKRLNDPDLGGYRMNQILQGNSGTSVYDLLWYDPAYCNLDVDLPRDGLFDAKVTTATFRSNWTDRGALFGGIHGAYNNVNHGHVDVGTFVLDALGVRWACDLGADAYALPSYMSNPNVYRRRAEGHNTIVVDPPGRQQGSYFYDQEPNATGVVEQYVSKDKGGYVVMDISQTNQKMASAKRGMFMLPGREQLLVQDEIELKSPGDVWWFMHTRTDVTLSPDRRSATLTYGGKTLNAAIVSPDSSLTFGVMDALPLEGSPVVDGQNQNKGFRKLYINGKDKKTFEVAVVFTPLPDPGIQPELPDWRPMEQWEVPDGPMPAEGKTHLTGISLDGQPMEGFYQQQNSYTVKLTPGAVKAPAVTAEFAGGEADMRITQAKDVNGTAVISLKDGETGQTKYYMVEFAVGTMLGVPQGVQSYAIADAVASDVPQTENGTENAYDGDVNTRWSAEGIQYVDFDLGEEKEVGAVSVAWYKGDERSTEYSVHLSRDGKRWSEVFHGISLDNTLDYNTTIFEPQQARYVRVTGYGNTLNAWNSVAETKIFPAVSTED